MILSSKSFSSVKKFNSLENAILYFDAEELPLEPYIHQFPILPKHFKKSIKINSEVFVNLFNYECSCTPFKAKCESYEGRDIRKTCYHINQALTFGAWQEIDVLTKLILKNQMKSGQEKLFRLDNLTILGTTPRTEWIRIYYSKEGRYVQYYYSKKQKRFSHGNRPPKWEEIQNILDT
jgi:hypothetical protein